MIRLRTFQMLNLHFAGNPIVKVFIVSETFFWSSWNSIMPIYAVFVADEVPGGNIETAASTVSVYFITRVIFELVSGKILTNASEFRKFLMTILGICIVALSFVGFAMALNTFSLYVFYALTGVGLGLASPAKNSLFSSHLDRGKESAEWGIYDAAVFFGMACSAALGGFIAVKYGFRFLFLLAAVFTLVGSIPYLLYLRREDKNFIQKVANKFLNKK